MPLDSAKKINILLIVPATGKGSFGSADGIQREYSLDRAGIRKSALSGKILHLFITHVQIDQVHDVPNSPAHRA